MHPSIAATSVAMAGTHVETGVIGTGEMAEWSIAAVLKTVEGNTSGGSNPSLSAHIRVIS